MSQDQRDEILESMNKIVNERERDQGSYKYILLKYHQKDTSLSDFNA